jgi:hypothetical protein
MIENIKIQDTDWKIDTTDLSFTDATLNLFFEKVGGIIDYIGSAHANSMRYHSVCELSYKQMFIDKFKFNKENGKSDKTAELYAEGDSDCINLKQMVINARYIKDRLYAHLQALNAAREDAHQRGHMLRKEMDKLNSDIRGISNFEN